MGCAQLIHGRFTRALVGEQAPAPVLAWLSDRTRRATTARPTASISSARKWKSYSEETSAGAGRPPDLCDSYNRRRRHEPADFTAERLAAARGTEALGSRLPDLAPTHDRGPRPLRRRSTWLLLTPRCGRARPRLGATAFLLATARAGLVQWRPSATARRGGADMGSRLERRDKPAWKKEMQVLYIEGVATHDGPESCVGRS